MYHCDVQLKVKRHGMVGSPSRFQATRDVLEQVRTFYAKANIPMVVDVRACQKILALLEENNKLRCIPQARRFTEAAARRLAAMREKLDATFPLWAPNAENLINNPEDLAFFVSMKGDRVATFGALDMNLKAKAQRRQERETAAAARKERSIKERQEAQMVPSTSALEDDESDKDSDADDVAFLPAETKTRTCKRKKCGAEVVIPPDLPRCERL